MKSKDESKSPEISTKIDMSFTHEVLEVLENMLNEELATQLLKEFNKRSKRMSDLVLKQAALKPKDRPQWEKDYKEAEGSLLALVKDIKEKGMEEL